MLALLSKSNLSLLPAIAYTGCMWDIRCMGEGLNI